MIVAVNVIPGCGDTPSIMIIDTGKLSVDDEEDKEWLDAIRETKDDGEQKTYPEDWDCLEKAEITAFPITIDAVANVYYEVD